MAQASANVPWHPEFETLDELVKLLDPAIDLAVVEMRLRRAVNEYVIEDRYGVLAKIWRLDWRVGTISWKSGAVFVPYIDRAGRDAVKPIWPEFSRTAWCRLFRDFVLTAAIEGAPYVDSDEATYSSEAAPGPAGIAGDLYVDADETFSATATASPVIAATPHDDADKIYAPRAKQSGKVGRPEVMAPIIAEARRRLEAREVVPTPKGLMQFARDLSDWWESVRGDRDAVEVESIANAVRKPIWQKALSAEKLIAQNSK
jgi:hypothetical protein